MPLTLRVAVEREARRMAGYRQGGDISMTLLTLIQHKQPQQAAHEVEAWLRKENDPRLTEIVHALMAVIAGEVMA